MYVCVCVHVSMHLCMQLICTCIFCCCGYVGCLQRVHVCMHFCLDVRQALNTYTCICVCACACACVWHVFMQSYIDACMLDVYICIRSCVHA